jgi:SAM-dependent methyltransferase
MKCRHCDKTLDHVFLDLGFAPPSNAYLSKDDLQAPEMTFPLKLYVCDDCWLVQTLDFSRADELFRADYAYFSSVSTSWLDHARRYCDMIAKRLGLGKDSLVIEVASNDGYLLKNFVASGIPCLGIEPTAGTAGAAKALGIPVLEEFFGEALGARLAQGKESADLIIGNNVYAHVPDINDFTKGLKAALKQGGTVTLEFPHLMQLIAHNQFDTVYHEHFSYLSLYTVSRIFAAAGLRVFDVETIPTHGGSLRVYGCHDGDPRPPAEAVGALLRDEEQAGLRDPAVYQAFQARADKVKNDFTSFLIAEKAAGRTVAAYGAAAKGNTLLNYAGIKPDLLPYVCDAAGSKQWKYMPGSHIPILPPSMITMRRPDTIVILPWNIADEVKRQLAYTAEWGARFVTAVPELKTFKV